MASVIKLLKDQRGQINWGGFAEGYLGARKQMQEMEQQREELKQRKTEFGLKEKLLGINLEKAQKQMEEDARQAAAVEALAGQFERPQPFARPQGVEGPEMESGAFGQLPAEPMKAAMVRAQPKETVAAMARNAFPTGAAAGAGATMAFPTMAEAMAASQTPEFKAMFPQGVRWRGTVKGFVPESFIPVNVPSAEYHATRNRVLAMGGTPEQAEALGRAAQQHALYGASSATGAGQVAGAAGQFLGESIQPMVPQTSTVPGPTPGTVTQAPQVKPGTYPTPSGGGGESPAQRAARSKATITREERPLGDTMAQQIAGLETLLQNTIPTIRQNLSETYLGPIQGTETAFEARRRVGSMAGFPVGEQETMFRTALRDAGDQLLRARSGAQINEQEYGRLRSILPKATDEPQVFSAALNRFEQELKVILRQKRAVSAQPRGGSSSLPQTGIQAPPPGWRPATRGQY